ncbi:MULTISPECIES: zinc-binding alcohol dehydrogenase family protein [Corynebacterium]|uniref:zinc-binding alcohol dehydrogenase family protein n=1 Tax=Corynebacterium TaxID=1716 RepID=UPI00254CFC5D|nr:MULTISPECIES: zinc-binding alcohol dehydrogenase family protein [Corynebacterium]MDK8895054.1 zinc-binding alcohol dehydrogenase family protein [Corynebacterium sp. MSK006]
MRAVAVFDSLPVDAPDAFRDVEIPEPTPGPHDVVVRVAAASLNPIDTKMRMRAGRREEPLVLGYDAVGTVTALGAEASRFAVGDRVFYAGTNNRPGSNAELQAVDERIIAHAPATLSDADAAALPLVSLTAWEALFDRLAVSTLSHGRLLVLGGAGGVPTQVIQLARALTGLEVVATASREASRDWVRGLGAHRVVDHSRDLVEQLGENSVNFVFSSRTDAREAELAQVMKAQSKLVLIDDPRDFTIAPFKSKAIQVGWESMFARPVHATADIAAQGEALRRVADLVDTGRIRAVTGEVLHGLDAATVRRGHELMEAARAVGKVALVY